MSDTQAMDTASTAGPLDDVNNESFSVSDEPTAESTVHQAQPDEVDAPAPPDSVSAASGLTSEVDQDTARAPSLEDTGPDEDSDGDSDENSDEDPGEVGEESEQSPSREDGEDGEEGGTRKKSRVRQLEREGEVAADFLETLLDIADLDGDIDVDVDGDRAAIAIVDSDEGRVPRRLVGTDGKVLEALQELTRLAVQVETGERSRLMLDIAGHRAERRSALVRLAAQSIHEVKTSGEKVSLEPMSAFERKVVHDEVSAAGLVSESEGVDPHRHIVILPS